MRPRRSDNPFRRNALRLPLHQFQFILMRYSFMLLTALFAFSAQGQTTFNVDMTCAPEGFTDVFVTGPWCGWCANDVYNTMTDDDGDGIYSVTVADLTGTVEYKYGINGFTDQENLVNDMVDGASCAPVTDFSGYANRQIEANGTANDSYGTCDGTCNDQPAAPGGLVTFQVNMAGFAGTYGTVNLNGSFNGWCGSCAAMTDPDGDGIFEISVELPGDTIEYKFTVDGWTGQEEFVPGTSCTSTIDGYTNRTYAVTGEAVLDPVCWNSCDLCPDSGDVLGCMDAEANNYNPDATVEPENTCLYDVTLTVDASQTSFATMCLAGTFQGWNPGANPMTDNGDGTYTITVSMGAGAQEYKFIGDCAWGGDEQFDGSESCTTDPAEFVNRLIEVAGPTNVGSVCYNSCDACGDAPSSLVATVDLCGATATNVSLTGPFWGWDPLGGPSATDNGDGTWSVTFEPAPADSMEYLWIVDGIQENLIQAMVDGGACAPVTDYANYANRLWFPGGDYPSDIFNSCTGCDDDGSNNGGGDTTAVATTFHVDMGCIDAAGATVNGSATFAEVFVTGPWCGWCANDGYNVMTDDDGDGIYSVEIADLTGTVEYKYGIDGFDDQEQLVDDMANGASCAPVTDFAGYANRQVEAGATANDTFGSCTACADQVAPANVTFRIDMNQYSEEYAYSGVFINGSFNGWCGECNPMDDADGDGIWELTLSLNPGTIEYKFTLDGWNYQEELAGIEGIEACTSLIDGYTNRSLAFDADVTLEAVCWESCIACDNDGGDNGGGDTTAVATAFYVDMGCIDAAGATVNGSATFAEVFVTGPWCGWCANDGYNVMTDDDGDGIYSVEIADLTGTVEYKYGIDGFDDQEQLVDDMANGASCAPVTDYAGYANRQIEAGATSNDVFGSCTSCADQVEPANVTFKVDMNQYAEGYAYSGVFINGSFNGWCGTCNPMDDADGDGVWELTLSLNPGTIEYKFTLDGWNYQEELAGIEGIEACTSLIDGYTNRSLTFEADVALDAVCWESCSACEDLGGCTDPNFLEFDPYAATDDGSCTTAIVYGCVYDAASNYNALANVDDNSCEFDGTGDCQADLDGDGAITTGDLLAFLASFGQTCL